MTRASDSAGRRALAWRRGDVRFRVAREVARREVRALIGTRIWRVTTVLLVVLTVVAGVLFAVLGGDEGRRGVRLGHLEPVGALQELLADPGNSRLDVTWVRLTAGDVAGALERGAVDVVVEPPRTLVWETDVDDEIDAALRPALTAVARLERAERLGLSGDDLGTLLAPVEITPRFTREAPSDDDITGGELGIALVLGILTFMGLQVYGGVTITGVVKEKADRVIEVLLAHVRTRELLLGKVVGIGAVAVAQVAAVFLTASVVLSITGAPDLPLPIWAVALLALAIFVLGFGFYATLLAVAGSLVSRLEDGQLVALPVMLPLVVSYVVGLSLVLTEPDAGASRLLSYFPLSSPVVMPIRVAAGSPAAWELALSVVLLAAAAWWTLALAGRVYESTLLHTGTRIRWREALRLIRRDTGG